MNINLDSSKKRTYDAIVIGSGISGGWSAKELCEKGLKTLVLERGHKLDHITDYHTALTDPWDLENRNMQTEDDRNQYNIQSRCYAFNDGTRHLFVRDTDNPYEQTKPFEWIRGYHVGGKSLMWARQTYRWSDFDFEANAQDGHGTDWPIRYADLAPWYSYVERFVGISGNRDGLPQIPDSEFLPAIELTVVEKHLQKSIKDNYPGRTLISGRCANLTARLNDRGPCQFRSLCHRGCPFSAAFASQSATLPAAAATKNMTLRTDSIVHSILYDEKKKRAIGVRVIDANTREMTEFYAKIIFVNAGTVNTTAILLNSASSRFPNGLGNDSGVLGHYLMDHCYRGRAWATFDGYENHYHKGRRPTGFYIPRFRNLLGDKQQDFVRGYSIGGSCERGAAWQQGAWKEGFGADFKNSMTHPGQWELGLHAQGECLPHFDNKLTINSSKLDTWGMPTINFDCQWRENELAMLKDSANSMQEMLETAGFKNIQISDSQESPGKGIHEMGTARMGRDPKTSVLNAHNQLHSVPNVFVTDGACMASTATQNPSLTYMALTARAADFAVKALKNRTL